MKKSYPDQTSIIALLAVLCVSIYGCASSGLSVPEGVPPQNIMETIQSGDARLTCGVSCSGTWGATRKKAKSLYENNLWKDLALEVAKVGFEIDQTYFYLGRAVEELDYFSAAQTYYKLALASTNKCAGIINNCDGLDVPVLAKRHLGRLTALSQGTETNISTTHENIPPVLTPQEIIAKLKELITSSQTKIDSYSTPDEISKLSNYIDSRLGSPSIWVICPCQKKYIADKQLYEITIFPHVSSTIELNTSYDKNANGIFLSEEREFFGTYAAANAFGVSKEVSKYRINEAVLGYKNNLGYEPLSLGTTRKSRMDNYRFRVPVAPAIAREQEKDINCLIRIKLEQPYLVEYQRVISPTLTTPIEADVNGTAIIGRFTELRVINQKTQEIYSVFK